MIISAALASTTTTHSTEHSLFQDPTFWVGVAFCITVFALVKLAGKAVSAMLQSRADKIAKQLNEAADLHKQAQKLLDDYKTQQSGAEQTARDALAQAEENAKKFKETLLSDFENKLKNRETAAEQRLDRAAREATDEIRAQAADVAMKTVEKLLTEKLTGEAGQKLIDDAIDSLPELFKDRVA